MRRLMVQAATTATRAEPPSASTSMAASCEAPAKTMVAKPMAAAVPSPSLTGVAPATSPKGTTPTSMGAMAAAPARTSVRSIGRSCPRRPVRPRSLVPGPPLRWPEYQRTVGSAELGHQGGVVGGGLALAGVAVDEDPVEAPGEGGRGKEQVDAHAEVLVEGAGPVVPPGEQPVLVVPGPEHVGEAPAAQRSQRLPLLRAHVGAAVGHGRVPDVPVVGSHVEVAA